jgi:exopolyphosphatase/guanosine-5'-triphosphate,3'-diphosphate pyrophosphatase
VKKIGIVDLGSNTARLVVYAFEPGEWFYLADQIREPVRLAEGLAAAGVLGEAAMWRTFAALQLFSDFARDTHLSPVHVVATSAVREARNRHAFLDQIQRIGLDVSVLSGEEEAHTGVLAVANSFCATDAWVMDLGGGTVQISGMRDRRFVDGRDYPLGAVRLTEAFLASDPPKKKEVKRLVAEVTERLSSAIGSMRQDPLPLIAMGGTVRNLARAVQKGQNYPLTQVHGFLLKTEDLEALVGKLLAMNHDQRTKVAGIKPDRADVILAGALVYRTVLRESGQPGLLISGQGLREGTFYRHFLPEPHLIAEVREFGIQNLFARYRQPAEHTEKVRFIAGRLFEELEPLHRYGTDEARLLDDAAWLHDIGMTVGYHGHHRHGAYLIDTGLLPGMTHRELALLTLLVRYHRKGRPRTGRYQRVLGKGDRVLLRRLATCLRLAEHLERGRASRVRDVAVEIGPGTVHLRLSADEPPRVEMVEAEKQADLFESAFGRRLTIGFAD